MVGWYTTILILEAVDCWEDETADMSVVVQAVWADICID